MLATALVVDHWQAFPPCQLADPTEGSILVQAAVSLTAADLSFVMPTTSLQPPGHHVSGAQWSTFSIPSQQGICMPAGDVHGGHQAGAGCPGAREQAGGHSSGGAGTPSRGCGGQLLRRLQRPVCQPGGETLCTIALWRARVLSALYVTSIPGLGSLSLLAVPAMAWKSGAAWLPGGFTGTRSAARHIAPVQTAV